METRGRHRNKIDTSTYNGRFAARLRMLREKAGLTVADLAEATGIPRATLYSWESTGRMPPISDNLLLIAEALNVTVRNLMPKE